MIRCNLPRCTWAGSLAAVGLMVSLGCRGNRATRQTSARSSSTIVAAVPSPTAGATPFVVSCSERSSSNINVKPTDYGDLQNVRIAADTQGALLTWQRLNVPDMGDSHQAGFGAFVRHDASKPVAIAMPARAYASAAYTTVGPTTIEGHLDFVALGVAGMAEFRAYSKGIGAWKGVEVFGDSEGPPPWQIARPPQMLGESLVVAAKVPLALLGGVEAPCGNPYDCQELYAAAEVRGLPRSLRTLSFFGKKIHTEVLFKGTTKLPAKAFVPAVDATDEIGLAAYRVDDQLKAQWIGVNGKPVGDAQVLGPSGDIGAPAVTMVKESAYVSWAYRVGAPEPYRLWLAQVSRDKVEFTASLDTGAQSAFAPAIATQYDSLVLAWTQGDAGRSGSIRLGRVPPGSLAAQATTIVVNAIDAQSPEGGNRRDPEIAVCGSRIYLTWSDFTTRKAGSVVLRVLDCVPEAGGS